MQLIRDKLLEFSRIEIETKEEVIEFKKLKEKYYIDNKILKKDKFVYDNLNIIAIRVKNHLDYINCHINYMFHLNHLCCYLLDYCAYDILGDYVVMNINWEAKNRIMKRKAKLG